MDEERAQSVQVDDQVPAAHRVSFYVQIFHEMISTVLQHEHNLFDEDELLAIRRFSGLSYSARYLFVRLFSRKNGWFKVEGLKYQSEIGDQQEAVDRLCKCWNTPPPELPPPPEIIDLTFSDDDPEDKPAIKLPNVDPITARPPDEPDLHDFSAFAYNEEHLAKESLDTLLSLLNLEQLKKLAKDFKLPATCKTGKDIAKALKDQSGKQATIGDYFKLGKPLSKLSLFKKGKVPSIGKQIQDKKQAQTKVLVDKIVVLLGKQIKLSSSMIALFTRLHLIFYRSTIFSSSPMTSAVLARFKKRTYPSYTVSRSFSIFESRQALIEYEEALKVERKMEELMGEVWDPNNPAKVEKDFEGARVVFEAIWDKWKIMAENEVVKDQIAAAKDAEEGKDDKLVYYRKRFLAGWPLTRVVYKGASVYSRLGLHEKEVEVFEHLLKQTTFRRGKRGAWYERLALVLMTHIGKEDPYAREEALKNSWRVCVQGLSDPYTHLIYKDALRKRILRLEKRLKVDPASRLSFPMPSTLKAATTRVFVGERVDMGDIGRKSIWRAMDGDEVSVEAYALEYYTKKLGFKGFHSENGILTTIFAMLFWDVLFAPVDGVFETPYQAAPLDLSTDAFSIVRADLIASRLAEIENGKAGEILAITDDREREKKTWCVGLKWDYEKQDLLEIVECIGGDALSTICRVYAEEWSHRTGGVPDLFLWNAQEKTAMFVEVKGPGDRLSETQNMWIHVLLTAGVKVERCSVKESTAELELYQSSQSGDEDSDASSTKTTKKRKRSTVTKREKSAPAPKREKSTSAPVIRRTKSETGRKKQVKSVKRRATTSTIPDDMDTICID